MFLHQSLIKTVCYIKFRRSDSPHNNEIRFKLLIIIKLVISTLQLFLNLLFSQLQYYDPVGFWNTFRLWNTDTPIDPHEQQDAFDFFQSLIDQLDEGMKVHICFVFHIFAIVYLVQWCVILCLLNWFQPFLVLLIVQYEVQFSSKTCLVCYENSIVLLKKLEQISVQFIDPEFIKDLRKNNLQY